MYEKTKTMMNKVRTYLVENEYISAEELAKKCHCCNGTIYRIIRNLRLSGIGVIPTRNGYVLSEFAKKSDDVGFIRRCFGRRTSDIIALAAVENDVRLRWSGVEDKNNINNILKYLSIKPTNTEKAKSGIKYLLSSVNGKGT